VEALGGPGEGFGADPGWGGCPRWVDFLPGRNKTAVSAPAIPTLHGCKSRRALPSTVTAVGYFVLPVTIPVRWPVCFRSFPSTHWNRYLWYSGLRTFLQY